MLQIINAVIDETNYSLIHKIIKMLGLAMRNFLFTKSRYRRFTMEFIGNAHDYTLGSVGNYSFPNMCKDIATNCIPRPVRGIN